MEQEWQQVSRRRKSQRGPLHTRRAEPKVSKASHNGGEEVMEPVPEVSIQKQSQITQRVRAIADVLQHSKLLKDALRVVVEHFELNTIKTQVDNESPGMVHAEVATNKRPKLVGYGLGSFCASSNAVHQLGFLVALREALDEGQMAVETNADEKSDTIQHIAEIFDPAMNKSDAAIAKHFQLTVIQENEHGRRRVESNTVFFMPHCGKTLYQNVVASNWGPEIKSLVIIGNSFSAYGDRVLASQERQELLLVNVLPYLKEVPLPCGVSKTHDDFTRYEAAFNDLSVHIFPSELLDRTLSDVNLAKMVAVAKSDLTNDL
ncbi:Protein Kinase [Phytophthora palmivora]|uniref:Protein Kinase n=1 Tax=Phytophthora palmivora TaxID=4796 RepID=A0A2P4XPY7_9STRA|nr:Protein Kinase [Phytophthora palmivora]